MSELCVSGCGREAVHPVESDTEFGPTTDGFCDACFASLERQGAVMACPACSRPATLREVDESGDKDRWECACGWRSDAHAQQNRKDNR